MLQWPALAPQREECSAGPGCQSRAHWHTRAGAPQPLFRIRARGAHRINHGEQVVYREEARTALRKEVVDGQRAREAELAEVLEHNFEKDGPIRVLRPVRRQNEYVQLVSFVRCGAKIANKTVQHWDDGRNQRFRSILCSAGRLTNARRSFAYCSSVSRPRRAKIAQNIVSLLSQASVTNALGVTVPSRSSRTCRHDQGSVSS